MNRQQYDKIIDMISPKIAPLGYECVEVEWDGAEETLRVYIDRPEGIKMEDCLRVNDLLIEAEELDALVPGDYRLEISSPGIERPLRTRDHFSRVIGQKIKVRLRERTQNRMEGAGKLLGIDQDDIVSLELPAGVWNFPFQAIRKANVVFEW
jgi:ribosome maturation factor RimP